MSRVHEPEDLPRPGSDPRLTWIFRGEGPVPVAR